MMVGPPFPRRAAVPAVQVGAADVGDRHADEDAVGLDLGQRELARFEGLPDAGEDEGATIHRFLTSSYRRLEPSFTSRSGTVTLPSVDCQMMVCPRRRSEFLRQVDCDGKDVPLNRHLDVFHEVSPRVSSEVARDRWGYAPRAPPG